MTQRAKVFLKVPKMVRNAIICDLDGTLAINNHGRSYYDATDCDKDSLNKPVATVVRWAELAGCGIIFLSGRENKYSGPTQRFLDKHEFDEDYVLIMRKDEDNRKDSIIKWELYEKHIKPMNVNILFILDDRNQVVEMWRSKGFTVFQVANGDF